MDYTRDEQQWRAQLLSSRFTEKRHCSTCLALPTARRTMPRLSYILALQRVVCNGGAACLNGRAQRQPFCTS